MGDPAGGTATVPVGAGAKTDSGPVDDGRRSGTGGLGGAWIGARWVGGVVERGASTEPVWGAGAIGRACAVGGFRPFVAGAEAVVEAAVVDGGTPVGGAYSSPLRGSPETRFASLTEACQHPCAQ